MVEANTDVWVNRYRRAGTTTEELVAVPLIRDFAGWKDLDTLPAGDLGRLIIEPGSYSRGRLQIGESESITAQEYVPRLPSNGGLRPIVVLQDRVTTMDQDRANFVGLLSQTADVFVQRSGSNQFFWELVQNLKPTQTKIASADLVKAIRPLLNGPPAVDLSAAFRRVVRREVRDADSGEARAIRRALVGKTPNAGQYTDGFLVIPSGRPVNLLDMLDMLQSHPSGLMEFRLEKPFGLDRSSFSVVPISVPDQYSVVSSVQDIRYGVVDLGALIGSGAYLDDRGRVQVPQQATALRGLTRAQETLKALDFLYPARVPGMANDGRIGLFFAHLTQAEPRPDELPTTAWADRSGWPAQLRPVGDGALMDHLRHLDAGAVTPIYAGGNALLAVGTDDPARPIFLDPGKMSGPGEGMVAPKDVTNVHLLLNNAGQLVQLNLSDVQGAFTTAIGEGPAPRPGGGTVPANPVGAAVNAVGVTAQGVSAVLRARGQAVPGDLHRRLSLPSARETARRLSVAGRPAGEIAAALAEEVAAAPPAAPQQDADVRRILLRDGALKSFRAAATQDTNAGRPTNEQILEAVEHVLETNGARWLLPVVNDTAILDFTAAVVAQLHDRGSLSGGAVETPPVDQAVLDSAVELLVGMGFTTAEAVEDVNALAGRTAQGPAHDGTVEGVVAGALRRRSWLRRPGPEHATTSAAASKGRDEARLPERRLATVPEASSTSADAGVPTTSSYGLGPMTQEPAAETPPVGPAPNQFQLKALVLRRLRELGFSPTSAEVATAIARTDNVYALEDPAQAVIATYTGLYGGASLDRPGQSSSAERSRHRSPRASEPSLAGRRAIVRSSADRGSGDRSEVPPVAGAEPWRTNPFTHHVTRVEGRNIDVFVLNDSADSDVLVIGSNQLIAAIADLRKERKLNARPILVLPRSGTDYPGHQALRDAAHGFDVIRPAYRGHVENAERSGETTVQSGTGWTVEMMSGVVDTYWKEQLGLDTGGLGDVLAQLPTAAKLSIPAPMPDLDRIVYQEAKPDRRVEAARTGIEPSSRSYIRVLPNERNAYVARFDVREFVVDGKPVTEVTQRLSLTDGGSTETDRVAKVFADLQVGVAAFNRQTANILRNGSQLLMRIEKAEPGAAHWHAALVDSSVPMDRHNFHANAGPMRLLHEAAHGMPLPDNDTKAGRPNLMGDFDPDVIEALPLTSNQLEAVSQNLFGLPEEDDIRPDVRAEGDSGSSLPESVVMMSGLLDVVRVEGDLPVVLAENLAPDGLRLEPVEGADRAPAGDWVRRRVADKGLSGVRPINSGAELEGLFHQAGDRGVVLLLGEQGKPEVYMKADGEVWHFTADGSGVYRPEKWGGPGTFDGGAGSARHAIGFNSCGDFVR
jgi:hypothetical protein